MLVERARKNWLDSGRHRPFVATLSLERAGLVLGRGTVLASGEIDGPDRLRLRLDGERLRALLSVAYGGPVSPSTLRRIRKAAEKWSQGEECQAALHLVFAGLPKLEPSSDAAWRLFLADELMADGVAPADVLASVGDDLDAEQALAKFFNEAETRVLAGNGRESGRWARDAAGTLKFLTRVTPAQWLTLAGYAARFAGPVAALGMMFFPNRAGGRELEGEIEGTGGLRYAWTQDETTLRITDKTGKLVLAAGLDNQGMFRDSRGEVVGRALDGQVVVDAAAVRKELPKPDDEDEEPKLCPAPDKDKAGRTSAKGDKDKDYEDYVKSMVNPENPTPRGFGVQLPDLTRGGVPVFYDDCQRRSGILIEAKGTGYAEPLLRSDFMKEMFERDWLSQATRQINASGGRPIQWHFAERAAADDARELFVEKKLNIQVIYTPWTED